MSTAINLSNFEIANVPCVSNRKWSIITDQGDTSMREMGNWREYQIRRLANDQEAAIDYLQSPSILTMLSPKSFIISVMLSIFLRVAEFFNLLQ